MIKYNCECVCIYSCNASTNHLSNASVRGGTCHQILNSA